MVKIDRPAEYGGPFEIDAYETTWGEYKQFLTDVHDGLVKKQIEAACGWNLTYERSEACPYDETGPDYCGRTGDEQLATPVFCLDQCDAKAYCEWAGKRLCMDTEPSTTPPLPWESEVYNACSNGGQNPDPNPDFPACRECEPLCEDATAGLYGLSTSFFEWTGYCRTVEDPDGDYWGCTGIKGYTHPGCNARFLVRAAMAEGATIRCCR